MSSGARWLRAAGKNVLLVSFGLLFGLGAVELYLRAFQPFHFRLRGDKIDLWPGREYTIQVANARRVDSVVFSRRNSLGFRGEEPPARFADHLTIVAVGGSTTECNLLSEGKTWPDLLGKRLRHSFRDAWINNAGLSGQSTFGHQVMMRDFVAGLRPKVVLFLAGINDIGLGRPKRADEELTVRAVDFRSLNLLGTSLARHSEVLGLGLNLYRYARAKQRHLADEGEMDLTEVDAVDAPMPEAEKARVRQAHRAEHLPAYAGRLAELVRMARANGIEPVLITQPMLFGSVIDDSTGVDLGMLDWEYQSAFRWELMEMYNDVMREVGRREGVLVVDLGRQMPKSSRYFYDNAHFTNAGAVKVAEIVYRDLCPFLASRYPGHVTAGCGGE